MNKQWIYRNGYKPFSVTEIKLPDGDMHIISVVESGFIIIHDSVGKRFNRLMIDKYDLIPYEPYADFKIDDEVYVKDDEHDMNPLAGHFAGLNENGQPTTFLGGCTSFTHSGIIRWNFCEKAAPINKEQ
jgi:hypothetical protein